ncbi:hypothetical protein GCM10023232_08790 [Sphingosinicella ginsenosidimutans]|uniref:ATP-dependent Clp protease proteolytic subunit n=1 Tax=Allosphingosinicella ginsenosidimutans TaxID=1176539 RepID=A0A5C6TY81_9SPHN|nr:hypothetical protein [Sphingosinicella ginsenosidimutans]TXC64688.1 hypothetical protein FRZ32_14145 [Sphingosinicella ginsenosidimutans]
MKILLGTLALPLAFLSCMPGCARETAAPNSFELRMAGDAVIYRGLLQGEGARELAETVRDPHRNVSRLVITSPGGEGPDALTVGEAIRDRGLDVAVDRMCVSACAIYVFVAGRHKTILPGSIVAYHLSPSLMVHLLRQSGRNGAADAFARQYGAAASFYRSVGADIGILDVAAKLTQPICVAEDERRPPNDPRRYMIAWRYTGFIPTREQLAAFGIRNVEGWWPQAEELPTTLGRLGFRPQYRPAYDPNGSAFNAARSRPLPALGTCPPSLVNTTSAAGR